MSILSHAKASTSSDAFVCEQHMEGPVVLILISYVILDAPAKYALINMTQKKPRKRTKVRGHYMQVRQRSTKKGKKGTILGKWKPKNKSK